MELLNTQYAGRYIFGGYDTDEAPYALTTTTITDSTTGETTDVTQITFKSDYLSKYGVVSSDVSDDDLLAAYTSDSTDTYASTGAQSITYNTGYSSDTAVNVEGQDITGTGVSNLFDTINKLVLGLEGDTSYKTVTETASTQSSSSAVSAGISGSGTPTYVAGESFVVTVDGTDYTVTLDSTVTDADTLQDAVDAVVGEDVVTVSDSSGVLTFAANDSESVISISDSDSSGALTSLGFTSSSTTSNRIKTSDTLAEISAQLGTAISFVGSNVTFSINGTSFTFSEDDTLEDVITAVNDADVGATLAYDSASDKLVLSSNVTGTGSTVSATDTSGTFVSTLLGDYTAGDEVVTTTDFTLDGLLDDIDANLELISTATASLGARMNYVSTCTSRLASDYTNYTGLLSSTLDADISVATTEYSTAQTIYDASLTVGAKVLTKSLVDYLT